MVKFYAKKCKKSRLMTVEDVEQELCLKLVQLLPKLDHLSESDKKGMVMTVLKNRFVDLGRFLDARLDTRDTEEFSDQFESPLSTLVTGFQAVCHRELCEAMREWAKTRKTPRAAILVEELIAPSDRTLRAFREKSLACPSYNQYEDVPFTTLVSILGFNAMASRKLLVSLRAYLTDRGFTIASLA
jgi:hypothetical protein